MVLNDAKDERKDGHHFEVLNCALPSLLADRAVVFTGMAEDEGVVEVRKKQQQ